MDEIETLAGELNSVAIHLVRRLRREDESLGVTPARLSALSVLVFGGPHSISRLAEAEQVAPPTMSKIVSALEQAGLVGRQPDPSDGRAVVLSPTREGRAVMERGRRQRVGWLAGELANLSDPELAAVRKAVGILRSIE